MLGQGHPARRAAGPPGATRAAEHSPFSLLLHHCHLPFVTSTCTRIHRFCFHLPFGFVALSHHPRRRCLPVCPSSHARHLPIVCAARGDITRRAAEEVVIASSHCWPAGRKLMLSDNNQRTPSLHATPTPPRVQHVPALLLALPLAKPHVAHRPSLANPIHPPALLHPCVRECA